MVFNKKKNKKKRLALDSEGPNSRVRHAHPIQRVGAYHHALQKFLSFRETARVNASHWAGSTHHVALS